MLGDFRSIYKREATQRVANKKTRDSSLKLLIERFTCMIKKD
jgi:hypothetical protein